MIERLEEVAGLYSFFSKLDVIDVAFESGHSLEVYVAMDSSQRAQGLSHVGSIEADGMLFWYGTPTYRPFTMREMRFDLDIAWYDISGNLIQHGTYEAGDSSPITCSRSFNYVLEVPAGTLPISNLKLNHG